MRLTGATFWGVVLGLAGIDLGAGTDVISNHQAVNQIVVLASTVGIAGLIANQAFPAPLAAIAGRLRALPLLGTRPVAYMPFAEACRDLYEADLDGWLSTAARQDVGDGEHPLRWCAYWIAPRFQEIYGRRPPSTVLERIPSELFTYAHFSDDMKKLTGGPGRDYVDLAVPRGAFRDALPMLGDKSWTSSNAGLT